MEISRKKFLNQGLQGVLALGAMQVLGAGLGSVASAAENLKTQLKNQGLSPENELFVFVFLKGGSDALSWVAPLAGEDRKIYEAERPQLKLPLDGEKPLLPLDERFGFHPHAKPLYELYRNKKLALVHSVGLPTSNRSHFDCQAFIELGTPGKKTTPTGWLTRYLQQKNQKSLKEPDLFQSLSMNPLASLSYLGYPGVCAIQDPNAVSLLRNAQIEDAELPVLETLYSTGSLLDPIGEKAISLIRRFKAQNLNSWEGQNKTEYPNTGIGNSLKNLSTLLHMNLNPHVVTVDMGGWDTHKFQGNGPEGAFGNMVTQLSEALSLFYREHSQRNMTLVVMSEFGRRLKENANRGTDHGHGGFMMVLGNQVKGGRVYGDWRGLKTENLYERADLAVTTDYRQVLSELLTRRFHFKAIDTVFPGWKYLGPLGVFKS